MRSRHPSLRRPSSASALYLLNKRGTVPVRDETGRFTGVRPKTAAERLQVRAWALLCPALTCPLPACMHVCRTMLGPSDRRCGHAQQKNIIGAQGGIFKSAAQEVLRSEMRLMSTGDHACPCIPPLQILGGKCAPGDNACCLVGQARLPRWP